MNSKIILATVALSTSFAFAQEANKDFGDLVPGNNFSITQQKTDLKDNADISNFQIKVSPQKEEFLYKVNSVRTPGMFKKGSFKLMVDRKDGKVTRITSEDYASHEDNSGTQGLRTVTLGTDGKVDSLTHCFQDYGFGLLNSQSNKSDFHCQTLNRDACNYLENNAVNEALLEKINNCSDMLGKFTEHQSKLAEMTNDDNNTNLKALGLKGGFLNFFKSTPKNFYDISTDTLKGISSVSQGYTRAVAQCKFLKEKDYFRAEVKPEVKDENKDGKDASATKQ